jgi:hypothetical protein
MRGNLVTQRKKRGSLVILLLAERAQLRTTRLPPKRK